MLLYFAAGDIGKYAKYKQKNEDIKDTGGQNQYNTWFALCWNFTIYYPPDK